MGNLFRTYRLFLCTHTVYCVNAYKDTLTTLWYWEMNMTKDVIDSHCCPHVIPFRFNNTCLFNAKTRVCVVAEMSYNCYFLLYNPSLSGWMSTVIFSVQRCPFKCSWHLGNCPFCSLPLLHRLFPLNASPPYSFLFSSRWSLSPISFMFHPASPLTGSTYHRVAFVTFSVHMPCPFLLKGHDSFFTRLKKCWLLFKTWSAHATL